MKQTLRFFSILAFFIAVMPLSAQNRPVGRGERNGGVPGLGRNALSFDIDASVIEDKIVVWNESGSKTTIPGRSVGIKIVGSNVVVVVQFTPFIRRGTGVLVAQSQIWIEDPERGISYFTSIQTIPMEFGEPILFFPLGSSSQSNSSIEIILTVNPINTENSEQTPEQ